MKRLTLLGSTGSIGASTLDVVARHPDRFSIFALTAHSNHDKLAEQCLRFTPEWAVVGSAEGARLLEARLRGAGSKTRVGHGADALVDVARDAGADTVVAAIVGAAGLAPTLAAARAGKTILLANKEALVMSGALFLEAVCENDATLLPLDSEHNAIYQCLPPHKAGSAPHGGVDKIILTASGGPFRTRDPATLGDITPEQAVKHPNWSMGRKISVDSATLMNKGLEVIEAHHLFGAAPDVINVVVHPQSLVHSFVEYIDGSVLAQLGNPDMRTAIAHALAWPERVDAGVAPLDLTTCAPLAFELPDLATFRCLALAFQALRAGGDAPAVLNAANEIAVEAFLAGALPFLSIADVVEAVLAELPAQAVVDIQILLERDRVAREAARRILRNAC